MEIHQQHRTGYVASDSGASSHFYLIDYTAEQHDPTADLICFGCANKIVTVSLAEDIIHFTSLLLLLRSVTSSKKLGCHCYMCLNHEKANSPIMEKQTHSNIRGRNSRSK